MHLSAESQVVVPGSFVDLFIPEGHWKPAAPREEIAARHEVCEDLAQALTEHATTVLWRHEATQQQVIDRILAGLLSDDTGLREGEARWVARRLAEVLEWGEVSF